MTAAHDLVRFAQALDFAARRHVHQRRKGEAAEPYINHLAEVTALVADATGGKDADVLLAALLHDSIEDVGVTRAEIEALFGEGVAALVSEVTDDTTIPKAARKRKQVEKAAKSSSRAKLIKWADKTSNLRSIAQSPPPDWSETRKREYFAWAREVVEAAGPVEPGLERQFWEAYEKGAK